MEFYLSFRFIALIFLGIIFLYTLLLIRSSKLSATLSVSWVMTEIILIIIMAIKPLGDIVMGKIGEKNLYVVISFFIVGWIILLMLNTLTRVSDLTNKVRSVIQENAILRERVELLERHSRPDFDLIENKNRS